MSEAQLQAAVLELASILGYLVYHTYDSRRSQKGFPDLTLVRGDRLLFVELKDAKRKVTPEQKVWLAALNETGADVFVWRPKDWLSGQIETVLRRPA